jgi:putative transposase
MTKKPYDSDLTDEQWEILKPFLERRHIFGWGRPRSVDLREVVNAILYLNKTGCQWRSLPHDFPAWSAVFYYFKKWRVNGTWEKVNHELRRQCRQAAGRNAEPTAACIDSQSVKGSPESGGLASGFDGGKLVKGRKRHIVVDVMGYVLGATVHAANEADTTMAPEVARLACELCATLLVMFADLGYKKPFIDWLKEAFGVETEVSKKDGAGFKPVRKRWVVERTFAWISRQRRMSRDYERTTESSKAMIFVSMIRVMLKQLSPVPNPWRKGAVYSPIVNQPVL